MAGKLDDLFSPERLRGKWQRKQNGGKRAQTGDDSPNLSEYEILYARIRELINKRFSGDDLEVLNALMDQLKELLDQRFDKKNGELYSMEEIASINSDIDKLLSDIEDIV